MSDDIQPLIVCMENNDGEKVSLRINPADRFQTFLDNAKTLLGYDIDLDSVTNNQPVSLEDNIYTFLLNMEDDTHNRKEDPLKCYELEYVLGDGTQIEASQIQFDNEDTIIDLSTVHIPFVKYVEGSSEDEINFSEKITTVNYVIPESPQSMRSSTPKSEFVNSLPFKLHCSNASNFEMYFNKYLELSMNTSTVFNAIDQTSKNDFKLRCNTTATNQNKFMTRDDILNIFKDSPVKSLPCEESKNGNHEKRKHVRKTDPLGQVKKNSSNKVEAEPDQSAKNYECCICDKIISNVMEKSYIFDKEDQMIHRTEQRKTVTHLKILCTQCLCNHFQPSIMKSPSQSLNNDEYLVIQNNQQFIFQKTTPIVLKKISIDLNTILSNGKNIGNAKVQQEINKEITSSFKGNAKELADVIVDTENQFSDAIEIIEPDIDCDNIDKIEDEVVMEFLGKNEKCDMKDKELICRFCDKAFENISQVVDHGDEHKHNLDDGPLYPCPLCDYGYAKNKWLKCHIKAVHHKVEDKPLIKEEEENKETLSREPSPVAKRTRSSIKNSVQEIDTGCNEKATQEVKSIDEAKSPLVLITEVKQEILDSSDEEAIWIVQAETEAQGNQNKQTSDKVDVKTGEKSDKEPKCNKCLQILSSAEVVKAHKCRKRERKRNAKVDSVKKPQKKKGKSSTEPRIVTCDICDESFSSRVRLKFHMQFHEPSANITADGEYLCSECDGATFPSETELFDHVHFQHKKKKRWQCPTEGCGKTFFMRTTLTKHIRTHTDTRRYVCVTCGKRFLNKQTLDEHSVTHLQIKPFSCHICLKQLTRRSRLRMHLRSHEEEPSPRLVLACAVCRRAFATATEATEHVTMSTECLELFALEVKKESETEELSPTTGIVTQYSGNKSSVNDPIEREVNTSESAALLEVVDDVARAIVRVVNIEKAFRCEYCEDVFYLEDALNKHRTIHKGVKNPFICHICKVSFATYSRCTTHKTTHGFYKRKEKDVTTNNAGPNAGILGYGGFPVAKHFLCEDCGRSYLHWTYLQVHRRMKHDNQDVLFQCNDCKSTFPNSWSVAYHRKKVHGKSAGDDGITKIKKEGYGIPCRDCDQLLANKNALYKHRLKEHSDQSLGEINTLLSEEKCMTCGKCGLQVQKLGDLEKHLREVHDDEQQMFSYDAHASTQGAGERRYRCEFCGVSFNRAATMRNHRQIHSGLIRMKWPCERCPRRFSARAELRAHLRLKHPARLAVIEIEGLNPSPEIVLNYLKMKNIQQRNVIDITMISFAQGTTNIVPNSARALSLLNDVPRTHIAREDSTFPRGHGIMQAPRPDTSSTYNNNWPSIIRPNTGTVQDYFSIRSTNDFANMSAELLLQDGGPIDNRNQEVQINPGDDAARIK